MTTTRSYAGYSARAFAALEDWDPGCHARKPHTTDVVTCSLRPHISGDHYSVGWAQRWPYTELEGATHMSTSDLPINDLMNAYGAVKARYALKHRERTFLDSHSLYAPIMAAANAGMWTRCDKLVKIMLDELAMADSFELAASEPVGALDYLDLQ